MALAACACWLIAYGQHAAPPTGCYCEVGAPTDQGAAYCTYDCCTMWTRPDGADCVFHVAAAKIYCECGRAWPSGQCWPSDVDVNCIRSNVYLLNVKVIPWSSMCSWGLCSFSAQGNPYWVNDWLMTWECCYGWLT